MGKVSNIVIVGVAILGVVFFMGCQETREEERTKPQVKVVSKTIKSPNKPVQKPLAAKAAVSDHQGKVSQSKDQPAAVSQKGGKLQTPEKEKSTSPQTTAPVTEAQVKMEKGMAAAVGDPSLFKNQKKYDTKNRVDPFIPLLEKKGPPQGSAKPKVPKRILTPLEKMDLSQIKLVAVIEINRGFIAMVEEASGKGYEVKIGTYMGRRGGRVTAIKKDRLMIREFYTDYQGKQRERNQEIKFHKTEGGE